MKSKLSFDFRSKAAIVCAMVILAVVPVLARPDFDVHPRTIEVGLTNNNWPARDTLRIDNAAGNDADTILVWSVEFEPEEHDWLTLSAEEGQVGIDRSQRVVVTMMGRDAPEDHNFVNLIFHSNDPTRLTYTVPVAGHKVEYPRITTGWNEQMGYWWGIDLNLIFDDIFYGDTCFVRLTIRNPGSAQLVIDELRTENGYWSIVPNSFNLDPNANRNVDFIFYAREVGANATTITSRSNAWDPNELNFRIIAGVNPVFRKIRSLPDTTFNEHAAEWLVADLDTLFLSSDRGLTYEVTTPNLRSRVERNGNLYLAPNPNWHGVSQVIMSATNTTGETLADTFQVQIISQPDAPAAFDLIAPASEEVIRWDAPDTLCTWQRSRDVDGDTVRYKLTMWQEGGSPVEINGLTDTTCSVRVLEQALDLETGGEFFWTAQSTDGELTRDAYSVFHNSVVPLSAPEESSAMAGDFRLLKACPNPFNSLLRLSFWIPTADLGVVTVTDSQGRWLETLHSGMFAAGRQELYWQPQNRPSGLYIISIEYQGRTIKQPVSFVK